MNFCHYIPHLLEFGIRDSHKILLSICDFTKIAAEKVLLSF